MRGTRCSDKSSNLLKESWWHPNSIQKPNYWHYWLTSILQAAQPSALEVPLTSKGRACAHTVSQSHVCESLQMHAERRLTLLHIPSSRHQAQKQHCLKGVYSWADVMRQRQGELPANLGSVNFAWEMEGFSNSSWWNFLNVQKSMKSDSLIHHR